MSAPDLPVRRVRDGAVLPRRAHPGDAGLDLVAAEKALIPSRGREEVPTGIAIAVPEGYAGLVLPRSGLARRHGVTLTNSPGLIDAGYRGEVVVLMINHGHRPHAVEPGDRIAQLVLVPVSLGDARWMDALPDSDGRGEGGFGSTGA
ncbi:MAG: dUTP diphosphatase [Thermoleophilia bacterium]